MNIATHSKLAWCATFARLLAFETKGDIRAAMRIAVPAFERDGRLPPARAVQHWLHSALTWPGTDPFVDPAASAPFNSQASVQNKSLSLSK